MGDSEFNSPSPTSSLSCPLWISYTKELLHFHLNVTKWSPYMLSQCIVIEDALAGVQAAKAAQMR